MKWARCQCICIHSMRGQAELWHSLPTQKEVTVYYQPVTSCFKVGKNVAISFSFRSFLKWKSETDVLMWNVPLFLNIMNNSVTNIHVQVFYEQMLCLTVKKLLNCYTILHYHHHMRISVALHLILGIVSIFYLGCSDR